MPSPLAEAFLMGILNGCYETPSYKFWRIYSQNEKINYYIRQKILNPPN